MQDLAATAELQNEQAPEAKTWLPVSFFSNNIS